MSAAGGGVLITAKRANQGRGAGHHKRGVSLAALFVVDNPLSKYFILLYYTTIRS